MSSVHNYRISVSIVFVLDIWLYCMCLLSFHANARSDLESVLLAILDYVFSSTNNESGLDSHQDAVQIFVRAATFSENDEQFTYEDFKNWFTLLPSVRRFLGSLLMPPDIGICLSLHSIKYHKFVGVSLEFLYLQKV